MAGSHQERDDNHKLAVEGQLLQIYSDGRKNRCNDYRDGVIGLWRSAGVQMEDNPGGDIL
jgi:hypothetical protein